MSLKLKEAQEHLRQAQKNLKVTLFRWKPDYEAAADEFNEAGQAYMAAKDLNHSMICFSKASGYYKKINALYHAAKALDCAMMASKEKSTPIELYNMACDASSLYQEYGSVDSAAAVLDRAARLLEEKAPQTAVKLYMQAAEVTSADENQTSGEYMGKSARLLVRLKRYDEAIEWITREIHYYRECSYMSPVGRLTVVIVLVQLARGDVVAAWQAYKKWGSVCESSDAQNIVQLLQAYDDEDAETARKALKSPFIRAMDVEYARLAELIKLPQATKPATDAATAATTATAASTSAATAASTSAATAASTSAATAASTSAATAASTSAMGLPSPYMYPKPALPIKEHDVAHIETAPSLMKPKETIKEPNLGEIHEDDTEMLC